MDESGLVQQCQTIEQLLGKYSNQCCTKTTKLILLNELVKVDAEQLEHKTEVLSVNECVFESQKMMIVILVKLRVELY